MIMQDSSESDLYAADLPSISHNLRSCLQVNLSFVFTFAHNSFMDLWLARTNRPFRSASTGTHLPSRDERKENPPENRNIGTERCQAQHVREIRSHHSSNIGF
jgi:hypothetical protein